jgi:hypothetical protein
MGESLPKEKVANLTAEMYFSMNIKDPDKSLNKKTVK